MLCVAAFLPEGDEEKSYGFVEKEGLVIHGTKFYEKFEKVSASYSLQNGVKTLISFLFS